MSLKSNEFDHFYLDVLNMYDGFILGIQISWFSFEMTWPQMKRSMILWDTKEEFLICEDWTKKTLSFFKCFFFLHSNGELDFDKSDTRTFQLMICFGFVYTVLSGFYLETSEHTCALHSCLCIYTSINMLTKQLHFPPNQRLLEFKSQTAEYLSRTAMRGEIR